MCTCADIFVYSGPVFSLLSCEHKILLPTPCLFPMAVPVLVVVRVTLVVLVAVTAAACFRYSTRDRFPLFPKAIPVTPCTRPDSDMLRWHCVQAAAAGAAAAAAISDLFSGTAFEESSLTSLYVFLRQLAWQERRRAGFGCRRRRWRGHSRGRRYAGGTAASSAPLGITECTLTCFSHWP